MVKGVSRRIVVVRAPEQKMFEEAIFILRDDALQKGVTAEDVVAQACSIASHYLKENHDGRLRHIAHGLICGGAGAALCGIIWLLTAVL